jgi:hypothetical protein
MFKEVENTKGIYRSLVNDSQTEFCMDFNPDNNRYPNQLVQSSFNREAHYCAKLTKYSWAPELLSIDYKTRQIIFKWYNNTCESRLPNDYKEQLEQIVRDLHKEQIYKPSFYPKYFYVDDKDKIHAYTFYSCSSYIEQPISIDFYKPILNEDRLRLVEELSVDGKLDMSMLVKYAFNNYIHWPGNILPEIYNKVYG